MRRVALALCAVCAWLTAQVSLPGQETEGSITGTVVSADRPGEPLRRAEVFLRQPGSALQVIASTDEAGRFVFSGVRPGRYALSATKPAYLAMAYGARQPGRLGTEVTVTAGQHLDGIRFVLIRGGVLSGVVRDVTGTPMANASIVVASANGGSRTAPGAVSTDDRGAYRVYGLAAGEYVIAAIPSGDLAVPAAMSRWPAADLDAALDLLSRSSGRAGAAPAALVVPDPIDRRKYGYGPVFYPGTPNAQDAGRIRVAAGEIREGLDFWCDLVPTTTVEATIVWPQGAPQENLALALDPVGLTMSWRPRQLMSLGPRAEPGVTPAPFPGYGLPYPIMNVTPGQYVFRADAGRGATSLWAVADVLINGADVARVTLTLRPAMSFSGRVVFETATAIPPAALTGMHLLLRASGPSRTSAPRSAAPDAGGAFAITGITPGTFSLSAMLPPTISRTWWLRSVIAGGRDLLDAPLDFGVNARDVKDAVLTFTDTRTEVTGALQTAAGQPATEYFVIVFSADRTHWFAGARRSRAVRPASDGVFTVTDLPAGSYLVAAVTDVDPDEWQRASFLEQLLPLSVPVTVRDGAIVRQDLQIAR